MSEYADIKIRNLSLCSFRNYVDDWTVSLFFSKNDLLIIPDYKEDPEDEDSGMYTKYIYKTTAHNARERLDALGFGIANFERVFNANVFKALDYDAFLFHLHVDINEFEKKAEERIRKNNITFKKWKNSMHKIITYELENGNIYRDETVQKIGVSTECDKVIFYTLKNYDSESFYGLHPDVINIGFIFRLMLESCLEDDEVVLDFSNLAFWADDCISNAIEATEDIERIIVLVEGTTDKRILEFSIEHLYPHLSDLLYFMDFDDANGGKRDGGTSFVVKNMKTFYFSKIKAKFIAVFDNDAEGYQSKCALMNDIKDWPENFRIILYPEIMLAKSYPTQAPNGMIVPDDINKKACSIELYLPDELIMTKDGYYPIEWESRKKIRTVEGKEEAFYQGVISHKSEIEHRFVEMKSAIEKGDRAFIADDWERMRQLLHSVIFAFA